MKTVALVNPMSGGVPADGIARMRAALDAADAPNADIIEIELPDCEHQLERIANLQPDMFVVWGGDGTLRLALSRVGQKTPNLLLLPGGTMNLLTKSLHGDLPWDSILSNVLVAPKHRKLSAGMVNGQAFYCAMLAGAPARFAEARESLRHGELAKAVGETRVALDALHTPNLEAHYRDGYSFRDDHLPTTSVIGALVGPLAKRGGMEIATLADPTATSALKVFWSSFMSDWRNAPGISIVPAQTLAIECEDNNDIPVIIDGEHIDAGSSVRVTYVKEAAQCLTAA